jgi:hypothetical protein
MLNINNIEVAPGFGVVTMVHHHTNGGLGRDSSQKFNQLFYIHIFFRTSNRLFRPGNEDHGKFSLSILKLFIDTQTSPCLLAAARSVRGHQPLKRKQVIATVQPGEDGLRREEIALRAEDFAAINLRQGANELLRRGVLRLRLVPETGEIEMR